MGSYSDEYLADWQKTTPMDRFWQSARRARAILEPSVRTTQPCAAALALQRLRLRRRWGPREIPSFIPVRSRRTSHHHYFRMGLIAHFFTAACRILTLRNALADAIKLTDDGRRAAITEVQKRMVEFRSRYWFREVSTQLQGQDIFRWWSDRLGNQELLEQVSEDIDAAASAGGTTEEVETLTRFHPYRASGSSALE